MRFGGCMAEQVTGNIWTIVGLSSLIAAVVTAILGLLRDVIVERYRFKRQCEADYLRNQIQIFSRIYFTLLRTRKGATGYTIFKKPEVTFKELNELIESNIHLLPFRLLNQWMETMALLTKALKEAEMKGRRESGKLVGEGFEKMLDILETVANEDLIPRYRKIVGHTVSRLSRESIEGSSKN
jgi:hypothetical protein